MDELTLPGGATWSGRGAGLWSVWEPAMSSVLGRLVESRAGLLQSLPARYQPEPIAEDASYPGVAIVDLHGPLERHYGAEAFWLGGASYEIAARGVREALADDRFHSIVLDIDSPGGTVDGVEELVDAVEAARGVKPIVAQGRGLVASAAYMVASLTDEVVGTRGTLVGSIGVKAMLYDFSEMFSKAGVKAIKIATGEHKGAGAPGTEITDSQRAEFERLVEGHMAEFRRVVMSGRSMSASAFESVADGRVWSAAEAAGLGLIDSVGTYEQTLARLSESGGGRRDRSTKGAQAMGAKTETDEKGPATPKAATSKELKAAFPTLDAEFRERVLDARMTMDEARVEAVDALQAQVESARDDREKAEAEVEKLSASSTKAPGVEPVGTKVKGSAKSPEGDESGAESGYDGDAVSEMDERVSKLTAGGKVTRQQAIARVRAQDPELHAAYLEATNGPEAAETIRKRFG